MNSKQFADLLIPDIDKTPEYYEEIYPERTLPAGAMVTRYAPSPTGFQHLGGVFAALIYERLAHQSNGIFFLRIEDTDKKREVKGAVEDIINTFKLFNIYFDEGMTGPDSEKGCYGPYKQSNRMDIYKTFVKALIEKGLAYPCFCTEDELDKTRKLQESLKLRTGYYSQWALHRNMNYDEAAREIAMGKPYVIRLKSQGDPSKRIVCGDLIKGEIEMPENDQDIVILKSDGLPTYHFAHAIDDHLMHTTHVVRGEEWLPSLPVHLQLFEMLGFKAPKYAHIPTLMKIDGNSKRKLSKRKDPEISIEFYRQQGYMPKAVIEYLFNLINSSYENWRKENPEKSCYDFKIDIDRISQSGALFDIEKLNNISRDMIAGMSADDVYDSYYKWLMDYDSEFALLLSENKEYAKKILDIERNVEKPRKDYAKWSDIKDNISFFFDSLYDAEKSQGLNYPDNIHFEDIDIILKGYLNIYDPQDDKSTWFSEIKSLSAELGYAKDHKTYRKNPDSYKGNISDVASIIRLALTNRKNTPDLYEIMMVMGKERVIKRLSEAFPLK